MFHYFGRDRGLFDDRTFRSQVPFQDRQTALFVIRIVEGPDNVLVKDLSGRRNLFDRQARNGRIVEDHSPQGVERYRDAARMLQIS
ncbi:MAG: hypothetical protein COX20_11785 [Desulfobacterales bacterium CG23_combo_of_CG06-09_8_20_14_all_52_9]|nr:MAG: hypothetical protein COX20_11785 [Desulfobacterales bacterium CG23_combo_of_CG06-09_8_20_14_all_52_9]